MNHEIIAKVKDQTLGLYNGSKGKKVPNRAGLRSWTEFQQIKEYLLTTSGSLINAFQSLGLTYFPTLSVGDTVGIPRETIWLKYKQTKDKNYIVESMIWGTAQG